MLVGMSEKVSSFDGFLYKNEQGVWLLCNAPNLKSCCLESHAVVTLEGDFSRYKVDSVVTVEGVYKGGTLSAVCVHEKSSPFPYWSLGAALLIICVWITLKRLKGRPLPL